jgi:hypothetical protein
MPFYESNPRSCSDDRCSTVLGRTIVALCDVRFDPARRNAIRVPRRAADFESNCKGRSLNDFRCGGTKNGPPCDAVQLHQSREAGVLALTQVTCPQQVASIFTMDGKLHTDGVS